jgi:hypothetical protein
LRDLCDRGSCDGKIEIGRPERGWEDIIELDHEALGCVGAECPVTCYCKYGNEHLYFIDVGVFIDLE